MESTIGDRIKQLAHAKGFNMSAFSEFSRISRSAISAILSGKSSPSYDMISRIATAFPEISMDWLLLGSGPMNKEASFKLPTPVAERPAPLELPAASDTACWEILKREEEQHELLKKDYAELKTLLRQARIELFLLQQQYAGLNGHNGDWSNTPAA